jgi:Protein of unknown function (DUF2589)
MADFVPLQNLVHAIASAVTQAQQEIEKAQVANLLSYVDREYRPINLQLRVPSIRPEAEPAEEDYYQAPLLALVPHSVLRIKQAEISFDIELGDLAGPAPSAKTRSAAPVATNAADVLTSKMKQTLSVNPAVSVAVKQQGTSAHIVLTIEGVEASEAVSRLVMDMTKTQGIVGPASKPAKT